MKIKNKGYIIGIISILVLASSISIFVPFISNHVSKHSKNSMLDFTKEYSPIRGVITGDNNQATQSLIKRLSSVVEYVTNSVIPKQNKLKCSILGGTDDSDVNHKKSELASFNSKTWIGKNRYSKETNATISNSVQRLKDEDKKINTIISAIKIHPYTYQAYLNKDGIIIPNIDFFINNENSITNLKSSKISNNLYTIGNTNPSINSVSLATEEATFSAKAISKSGMSLTRAVFSNISFTAKIITFNTKINGFQFASTTTIKGNDKSTSNTMIPSSNSLNIKNSEFIGTTAPFINDSFYLSSNKINLSKSLSRNNTLLINSDAVSASNYSSNNIIFGIANINYNGVSQFRYNKLLYSLLIVYPLVIAPILFHSLVGMSVLTIEFIGHKLDKRIKKNVNAPDNLSEAQPIVEPIPPVAQPIADPISPVAQSIADSIPPVAQSIADSIPPVAQPIADSIPPVDEPIIDPFISQAEQRSDNPPIIFPDPEANDDDGHVSSDTENEEERIPTRASYDENSKELVVKSNTNDAIPGSQSVEINEWITQKNQLLQDIDTVIDRCYNKEVGQEELTANKTATEVTILWSKWTSLEEKVKRGGEFSQVDNVQVFRYELKLMLDKLIIIVNFRKELQKRDDGANDNRRNLENTLPKADKDINEVAEEATDDIIDDGSTDIGSSTLSDILKNSLTDIHPLNTNDVLEESSDTNDESIDNILTGMLWYSRSFSEVNNISDSMTFVNSEQKDIPLPIPVIPTENVIPSVPQINSIPVPESTTALPAISTWEIIPTLPTITMPELIIPKKIPPLPRVARTKKSYSLEHLDYEIKRANENLRAVGQTLDNAKSIQSLSDKNREIISCRDILNKTKQDIDNITQLIAKESTQDRMKYSKESIKLFELKNNLDAELLNLELKTKSLVVPQEMTMTRENLEPAIDKQVTNSTTRKEITNTRRIIIHEPKDPEIPLPIIEFITAVRNTPTPEEIASNQMKQEIQEYFNKINRFRNEFILDNADLFLQGDAQYGLLKQQFIDSTLDFSNRINPPSVIPYKERSKNSLFFSDQARIINYRLKGATQNIEQQEIKLEKQYKKFQGAQRKSMIENEKINNEKRMNALQNEIKRRVSELNKESGLISYGDIGAYNEITQNKIDELEAELGINILNVNFKEKIRARIPGMRDISNNWTLIRKESFITNSKVVIAKTGRIEPNSRWYQGKIFNIEKDLLAVFGTDI